VSTGLFTAEDARVKLKRLPSMILGIDDKKHWHSVLSAQLLSNRQSHQGAGKELETPLAWIEKVSPVILFTHKEALKNPYIPTPSEYFSPDPTHIYTWPRTSTG